MTPQDVMGAILAALPFIGIVAAVMACWINATNFFSTREGDAQAIRFAIFVVSFLSALVYFFVIIGTLPDTQTFYYFRPLFVGALIVFCAIGLYIRRKSRP